MKNRLDARWCVPAMAVAVLAGGCDADGGAGPSISAAADGAGDGGPASGDGAGADSGPGGADTGGSSCSGAEGGSSGRGCGTDAQAADFSSPDALALADGAGEPPDAADAAADVPTTGDPSVLVGAFQLELVPPVAATAPFEGVDGFTSLFGKVFDGPTPDTVVWDETAAAAGCRLLVPRIPFCDGGCEGGAACVQDDTCQAYPKARAVGTVHVTGVKTSTGATAFDMDPIGTVYQPTGGTLPFPAFEPGDPIEVSADGGDLCGPFSLAAAGVAPLSLSGMTVVLEEGSPLALTWSAPGLTPGATVHVKVDLSHHGGSKGLLLCELADTGTFTVPQELSDGLVALGYSGFPTIVVARRTVGSAVIPAGRVDLVVSSGEELPVSLPGLTSCTDDSECPEGETCRVDLKCE